MHSKKARKSTDFPQNRSKVGLLTKGMRHFLL